MDIASKKSFYLVLSLLLFTASNVFGQVLTSTINKIDFSPYEKWVCFAEITLRNRSHDTVFLEKQSLDTIAGVYFTQNKWDNDNYLLVSNLNLDLNTLEEDGFDHHYPRLAFTDSEFVMAAYDKKILASNYVNKKRKIDRKTCYILAPSESIKFVLGFHLGYDDVKKIRKLSKLQLQQMILTLVIHPNLYYQGLWHQNFEIGFDNSEILKRDLLRHL